MNLILITACPSGMATTFLAAKRLEQAAMRLGWNVHVEMHGEIAPLQAASAEQIANADLIVVAADHVPAPERFEGKRLFQAPIASALPDPSAFLSQAKREAPIYSAPAATAAAPTNSAGGKKIVAVTACPTGVAHTFMAAEALTEAGKAMGHQIRVETQARWARKTNSRKRKSPTRTWSYWPATSKWTRHALQVNGFIAPLPATR